MKYIITVVLLFCLYALVFADESMNKDDDQLHQIAASIMQNLQKDHMPSDNSGSGPHNAPLHHMHNIGKNAINNKYLNKTDNVKVTVGVKGIKFVSIERNGKVVNITTTFGVVAAALYKIEIDSDEDSSDDNNLMSEESNEEIDNSLESMRNEYIDETLESKANETNILIGQKARFGLKLSKNKSGPKVKVNVNHGYLVSAKTNVTKSFN